MGHFSTEMDEELTREDLSWPARKARVVRAMKIGAAYTARSLGRLTGLHKNTVAGVLRRLRNRGYVVNAGPDPAKRGAKLWRLIQLPR